MQGSRRLALAAVVLALATAAGCSGLGGNSTSGYGVAGPELTGERLTGTTASAVTEAGSYTLSSSVTLTRDRNGTVAASTSNVTTRVDFDARRGLRRTTASGDTLAPNLSVVYTADNRSYLRQRVRGTVTYDSQRGPGNGADSIRPVSFTGLSQNFTTPVDAFRWERNGTTTLDGTTVTRYTVVGVANNVSLTGRADRAPERAAGTLLVDGDGVVRELAVTYTVTIDGEQRSYDGTIRLDDLGSTSVTEPDWLGAAPQPRLFHEHDSDRNL